MVVIAVGTAAGTIGGSVLRLGAPWWVWSLLTGVVFVATRVGKLEDKLQDISDEVRGLSGEEEGGEEAGDDDDDEEGARGSTSQG